MKPVPASGLRSARQRGADSAALRLSERLKLRHITQCRQGGQRRGLASLRDMSHPEGVEVGG
jgi:hypothetical protein